MNITGEVGISKIKLSKPFHSFKLEYGKAVLISMLRNWYWWLLFALSIAGIMVFDSVYIRIGADYERVMFALRISFSLIIVPMVAAFFLSFRGRLSVPYGDALAYSCGPK